MARQTFQIPDNVPDMPGRNVFHESTNFSHATISEPCIFLSHRKADKPEARELANELTEAGCDIYFDERDECLQGASEDLHPKQVVGCIDAGLGRCTHLLGLITPATSGSWWVPYEIGAVRARGKFCAFLIHQEVTAAPAYITVAELLADRSALRNWVQGIQTSGTAWGSTSRRYLKLFEGIFSFSSSPSFLPLHREPDSLKFY